MARRRIGELLVAEGVIREDQRDAALAAQQAEKRPRRLGEILVSLGAIDQVRLARTLASQLEVPYVDPLAERVDPGVVWRLPRPLAERHRVLALAEVVRSAGAGARPGAAGANPIRVAMVDPLNAEMVRDLEFALKAPIQPEIAAETHILGAIRRHYDLEPVAQRLLHDIPQELRAPTTAPTSMDLDAMHIEGQLGRDAGGQSYVRLLNFLLVNAIERNASDIHMEAQQEGVRVRYRIDGLLREVLQLPVWASAPFVSRIKVFGKMDIAEKRRPQDGRAAVELGKRRIDLRISIVPSQFGETVVIRLLDSNTVRTDLGALGWNPRQLSTFFHVVSQPQGLALVVGPTGSGKTTTLYASINRIRSETSAIVTIEDPIEHTLEGIAQVQVSEKTGVGFPQLIRSVLRQDPDVLVVGEIRDDESALVTAEAANTGHLVLSTLHTGHSVGAITRMRDMAVPAYLLGSVLQGVVAQRLVRRVCPVCSIVGSPAEEEWERLGIDPQDLGPAVRRVGPGCPTCQYAGYAGRVGVFEVLAVDDHLRGAILRDAPESELWGLARAAGLFTLLDDGLDKVREGLTTLEELAGNVPVDPWRPRRRRRGMGGALDPVTSPRPVAPPRPVEAPAPVEPELAELGAESLSPLESAVPATPKVLVVDDAEEILTLISATLEGDYEVVLARDGVEALEQVARERPDVLVLDVMMPRMSGYEVCNKLKADPATETIPVLMLSARGDTAHVKQGLIAGADDYLPKPFDPEELELRIRAVLRRANRR